MSAIERAIDQSIARVQKPVVRDNPDSDTGRVKFAGFEHGDGVQCSVHVNACLKVAISAFLSFSSVAAHEVDFLL